jgi:hypothetical protein
MWVYSLQQFDLLSGPDSKRKFPYVRSFIFFPPSALIPPKLITILGKSVTDICVTNLSMKHVVSPKISGWIPLTPMKALFGPVRESYLFNSNERSRKRENLLYPQVHYWEAGREIEKRVDGSQNSIGNACRKRGAINETRFLSPT